MQHSPGFLALVTAAKAEVKEIELSALPTLLAQQPVYTLIDVREESEWALGHLPQAIHLSKGIIERDIEQRFPSKDTPLLLYCGGGFRSILAAQNLQKMGYRCVLSLSGGYKAWAEQNLHP